MLLLFMFLAFFQAAKLARAHLVLLSVFAGTMPFERTASCSSSTNVEKRSLLVLLLRRVELEPPRTAIVPRVLVVGWVSVVGVVLS